MTSLTIVRRIAARPSIVFDMLSTSEGVAAWWGPDAFPVISARIDARVGGRYRVRFKTFDGVEHEATGEIVEVSPPHHLAMTWTFTAGGEPEEEGRVSRIAFEVRAIQEHGWSGALDKLVALLRAPKP